VRGTTAAYLSPGWCTALSLGLALPTLGTSLLLVPILWVMQHDRTAARLGRLRREVQGISSRNADPLKGQVAPPQPQAG
jgi:hypothetical protein